MANAGATGRRWVRLVPGIAPLRGYRRSWLRGDALAGLTIAAYLVPQVMAYATLAGLPPVAGLWAVLAPLAVYAVLGSSRHLSVGPESTTALMTAAVVAPLAGGSPTRYAALAAALAVVVGVLCLAAAVARLGFLADLLSKPILVGYLTGVAIIMIIGQLGKVTGIPVTGDTLVEQVISAARNIGQIDPGTLVFSVAVLVLLFVMHWRWPHLPGPLLTVLLATAAVAVFGLRERGLAVVGTVPRGLPTPALPGIGDLTHLLLPAVGLMVVGYTDTVLTARAFAARGGYRIDANQEMLALGVANVVTGALRGFPVSSSGSRTAIGFAAGGRTQVSSVITLGAVIGVLLFAAPLLQLFPVAALGALVVFAAVQLIDVAGLRRLAAFRRSELLLAVATIVGVLTLDILYGVLFAIGLSAAELLRRVARPHDAIQGVVPGLAGMHDIDDYPQATTTPGLLVYRYDSPLFFANAEDFRHRARAAAESAATRWFVLNTEANVEVDITALEALDNLRKELTDRGVVFAMARVKRDLQDQLDAYGLTASIGTDRIFPTLPTAVAAYQDWRRHHDEPPGSPP
ncbi:sulfate permease [Dactylosporangium sp. NPDC049140]|uniref:SulP family inorganic anion transporter n=1 Tax=Dactylosporangium sp. NPDC049140 TaxID=3155647 RepID=UPI0033E111BC